MNSITKLTLTAAFGIAAAINLQADDSHHSPPAPTATREGLWLTSTVINGVSDRCRIVAAAVGRQSLMAGDEATSGVRPSSGAATSEASGAPGQPRPAELLQLAAPEDGRTPALVVVVNDAQAAYPVRIDPTFSDANRSSMGGFARCQVHGVWGSSVSGVNNN